LKIAVFPGSFDPITRGHHDIVLRALPLFDKIIVAVGVNANKKYMFSTEERMQFIRSSFPDNPKVEVTSFDSLTVDFCRSHGAEFVLRGLRNPADFEFEKAIAHVNHTMAPEIDSLFFLTSPEFAAISSSIIRDIHGHGGDIRPFIPEGVHIKKDR
jgi:pantetheine-phosphate adenylyltransferase